MKDISRRTILRSGAIGLATAVAFRPTWADQPKLREDDPIADMALAPPSQASS